MKNRKKNRLLCWLNGISLFSSFMAVCFSLLHIDPFTFNEATFIGILVSLMGIVFTLFVGYQIYNAIEVKKDLQNLYTQKKKLEESIARLADFENVAKAFNFNNRALLAINEKRYAESLPLLLSSLKYFLLSNSLLEYIDDVDNIIYNIEFCKRKLGTDPIEENVKKDIRVKMRNLLKLSSYSLLSNKLSFINEII